VATPATSENPVTAHLVISTAFVCPWARDECTVTVCTKAGLTCDRRAKARIAMLVSTVPQTAMHVRRVRRDQVFVLPGRRFGLAR